MFFFLTLPGALLAMVLLLDRLERSLLPPVLTVAPLVPVTEETYRVSQGSPAAGDAAQSGQPQTQR